MSFEFARSMQSSGTAEVELKGVVWRVSRPDSKQLLLAGAAFLAMLPSDLEGEKGHIEQAAAPDQSPEATGEMMRSFDALVVAGLEAVKPAPDRPFEAFQAVMTKGEALPGTPRVWVENLPTEVRIALAHQILALADDEGRWARALNTFRGESDAGADR